MRNRQSPLGTLVVAIVFFVAGFTSWKYFTKPLAKEAAETKNWPTVEGIITFAELNKTQNSDGNDMYYANVQYTYSVDGNEYTESSITTADGTTSMKNSVKKQLRKYAKGTKVTVYYDPEFPNTAVLEPGAGLIFGLLLKLPLLFCGLSVLIFFGLIKRLLFRR